MIDLPMIMDDAWIH